MTTLSQKPDQVIRCTACGANLPANARFCEQCGQPVLSKPPLSQPTPTHSEYLLIHIPVEVESAGKGFFGRTKYTDYELLITNQQLLFLRLGSWDDRWLQEQNELNFDTQMVNEEFAQWRSMIEQYVFSKPLWNDYYSTPFDELLTANKHNFAVKVNDLVSASIELDNELDTLNLSCADGTQYRCKIYLLLGAITHRLLAQVLDSSQLEVLNKQL